MKFAYEPREVVEIDDKVLVVYQWGELTERSSPKIWENVELFDSQGKKIWTVNGMENCKYWDKDVDTFVGIKYKAGRLQLTSFSGNSYNLNLETGEVVFSEFHK